MVLLESLPAPDPGSRLDNRQVGVLHRVPLAAVANLAGAGAEIPAAEAEIPTAEAAGLLAAVVAVPTAVAVFPAAAVVAFPAAEAVQVACKSEAQTQAGAKAVLVASWARQKDLELEPPAMWESDREAVAVQAVVAELPASEADRQELLRASLLLGAYAVIPPSLRCSSSSD